MVSQPLHMAIVIPCYNESATLEYTFKMLLPYVQSLIDEKIISSESSILLVDDGSTDSTWNDITAQCAVSERVRGLKLAHNVGHQTALLAGMLELRVKVDCLISLDADLQDDFTVIRTMLERYREGFELVYGVRSDRTADTWFKRTSAGWFYTLAQRCGMELLPQHADFRLVGARALDALGEYQECQLFLRAIFPRMGFKHTTVTYERAPRRYGESKYPLRKMVALAWEGITSFSAVPLRLAGVCSLLALILSLLVLVKILSDWVLNDVVLGWTSIMCTILFFAAVQLFFLSIIGEYLGKIYMEVKRRPRYCVETRAGQKQKDDLA